MKEIFSADSHQASQIRKKIEAIAICLKDSPQNMPGLMGGKCGELLFLAYYSRYKNDIEYHEIINDYLSVIFDKVQEGFRFPSFAGGLAGIGWTVEHLAKNKFISAETDRIIGQLDEFLYPHMINDVKSGQYDYLHGALGIGLYYMKRLSNQKSKGFLISLIDELERISININNHISWQSEVSITDKTLAVNLSLSHGLASIIVFFSRVYEYGIEKLRVSNLINGTINYMLRSKLDVPKNKYFFNSIICKEKPIHISRLAWCYSDLGICIALWQAGNTFNNNTWKQVAIEILLHTTSLTEAIDTRVVDAGICHGASGIAHIYNRMYNYSNIEVFKEASAYWFGKTLEMANFEDGLSGYKSFRSPDLGGWQNDYSFLEGIAGIGITMISSVSDIEPKWDQAILLS